MCNFVTLLSSFSQSYIWTITFKGEKKPNTFHISWCEVWLWWWSWTHAAVTSCFLFSRPQQASASSNWIWRPNQRVEWWAHFLHSTIRISNDTLDWCTNDCFQQRCHQGEIWICIPPTFPRVAVKQESKQMSGTHHYHRLIVWRIKAFDKGLGGCRSSSQLPDVCPDSGQITGPFAAC